MLHHPKFSILEKKLYTLTNLVLKMCTLENELDMDDDIILKSVEILLKINVRVQEQSSEMSQKSQANVHVIIQYVYG